MTSTPERSDSLDWIKSKFELFHFSNFSQWGSFSIFSFIKCLNGMAKSNSHMEKKSLYPACFNSLFLLFIWRLMFQLNPQKGSFLFFSEVLAAWHECPTIISLPIESTNGLECGGRKKNVDFFICLIASFTVSCYLVKVWKHCVNLSSYLSHATGLCIKYQFLQHLWNVSKRKKKKKAKLWWLKEQ